MGDLADKMLQNAKTSKAKFLNLRNEIKAYLITPMQRLPNFCEKCDIVKGFISVLKFPFLDVLTV